jgi:steroid delta-isomerase-like uncharacterized protein
MGLEDNKALYRRVLECINKGDHDGLDAMMSSDVVDHNPEPEQGPGLAGFKQWMTSARTTFPDLKGTLEDLIAEGDKVVGYVTWHGTQQADFADIPPTGKQVTFQAIHIVRVADGKIAEWWGVGDIRKLVGQLRN